MSDEPRGSALDERPEPDAPPEDREERRRGLPPIGYPLLAVLFGGALVWSFSRVLLAVDKDQAVAIAILMALNILVGAALVAYGGRVRRRPAAFPALLFAGLVVIGIGLAANFAYGDRGPEKEHEAAAKPQTVEVTAQNTTFLQTKLSLTAGAQVTIDFDNKDAATQHNIAIFKGHDATGPAIFRGDLVTGPKTAQYRFKAPQPGTYFFHCEVHPGQMKGTIKVTPPGKATSATTTVTASGTAFTPTKVQAAPAGGKVSIHFVNKDPLPHNIVVFNGTDATAPQLFRGEVVTGPDATTDYSFQAHPPGTYYFHCEVHPTQMKGTITLS